MNSLSSKQRRELINEFCPHPGYVLKLSRKQFEELVEDTLDVDLSEVEGSNGKRFEQLLKSSSDDQITRLTTALREL